MNEAESRLHSTGPKLKSDLDETNGWVSQEVQ